MARIVVALGGNALGQSPEEQLRAVQKAASAIVDLAEAGNDLIIAHGNGPPVGMIKLGMDSGHKHEAKVPYAALKECGAMSQGYIGYHLQQAIQNEYAQRNINRPVATVVTQVEVDKNDPAFQNPTKPVGNFYTKEEAEQMQAKGLTFIEDAGRGYRQVVPSPMPKRIVELDVIRQLSASGILVIAVGGGGVPVVRENGKYVGIDAVIDKDNSSAKLADELNADQLIILTAVEKVAINFNKPNQQDLSEMTVKQAEQYIKEGQFAKGSMLPKVQACLDFVHKKAGREAIITSLFTAKEAIQGLNGTRIK